MEMNEPSEQPSQGDPAGNQNSPPTPRKSGWRRWILVPVGAVLLIIGVVQLTGGLKELFGNNESESVVAVGNCLYFDSLSGIDSKPEKRACSDLSATYEVASMTDGTTKCETTSLTYLEHDPSNTDEVVDTACLVANLQEGQCYKQAGDKRLLVMSCTASDDAVFKTAKRIDGKADESLCREYPPGSAATFDQPVRTYCLITDF